MSKKGNLFVVTGPSGAGKGSVLAELFKIKENIFFSVSATTRQPRPGEKEGINYFFVSKDRFEEMISCNELLEHAEYVGNYYGTPENPVNEMLKLGKDVILEIEVQGALQIKKKRPDAITVFIAPPSFEVLASRLRNRGTESDEVVARRLEQAKNECRYMSDYDYIVINDSLEKAVSDLSAVIPAPGCRSENVDLRF